ncbi:MAG: membrane protein insertion efficiency factor YidD [Nostocaceae cyanobacterium]|nr:membrane protein insertion efficiency factor YidD [Nostocaceae cyanobacterium]
MYLLLIMEISPVDSLTRQISVAAITGYQKHISPHKGFACAHRVLYGGESCSQYVKRVIATKGLRKGLIMSRTRFQACKEANQILQSHAESIEPPEEDFPNNTEAAKQQKERRRIGRRNDYQRCNSLEDRNCYVNCAELGCDFTEISFDLCDLDCSIIDCGLGDCNILDCASCG